MFRKQIAIALACASLICAFTTVGTIDTSKRNATAPQPVLVARARQGGGKQGPYRGGRPGGPNDPKPIVKA
ncbi:MAG TPA: hypothetical protein VNY05_21935 [Candidatus Acidoferrales bacterium]|jgi:hypothetical protein|nr:hypothetical protein [Candidatus Acidoferrales bacterium]